MCFVSNIKLGKTIKLLIGLALGFGREWIECSMNEGEGENRFAIYLHSDMGVKSGVTLILLEF